MYIGDIFYNSSTITEIFVIIVTIVVGTKQLCTLCSGILYQWMTKTWSPYSCNGRKHCCKHVSDSVPSSFDTRKHFDYNIASLTDIVINCSVSSSSNDRSNH